MEEKNKATKKRGLLRTFIIVFAFILLAAGGGVAGYLIWPEKFSSPVQEETQSNEPETINTIEPIYVQLNTFTVSLKSTEQESDRVLYLGVTVSFNDKKDMATLEKFMPEYRGRLFMLLTHQTYEALSTDEGKKQLIDNIKHELSLPLAHRESMMPADVLINEFILR